MESWNTAPMMGRCSWSGLSLVFITAYLLCVSLLDRCPPRQKRPFKYQRDVTSYDVIETVEDQKHADSRNGSDRINSTLHNKGQNRRNNIVQLPVDIENFPAIDVDECPSMIDDVMVAPAYSMPLTALASFPRSGNSWTRSLIQVATRYSTGSVHWEAEKDRERVKEFFKAGTEDFRLQKGICIKTHFYDANHIDIFENGAILLIRNPYYSVVSDYFRFFGGTHNVSMDILVESMESKNEHWTNILLPQFRRWRNTALNWIRNCKRLLIVYFEDLEQHTAREVTRMVKFLGQPVKPKRILCAVENFIPKTSHRSKMTFDPYTLEMHKILDGYIADVNRTLIAKGVPPLPTYPPYNQAPS